MGVDTVRPGELRSGDTGAFVMTKSPMLALGLSAVLPGAGQMYNGQWWKAPIIYAGIGGMLAGAYVQHQKYAEYRDSVIVQTGRGDLIAARRYTNSRNFYRDDRDKLFIYTGLIYIANLLDAYISAHLYDFDVSDPGPLPEEARFSMPGMGHVRFNYRHRF